MLVKKPRSIMLALFLFLCFTAGAALPAAWAKEPATPELSLKEAVLMAWSNSEDVKAAELGVEKAEEQRQDASHFVEMIPASGPSGNPNAAIIWTNFLKADIAWQMAKKDLQQKKDNIVVDVFTKYYTVINCQDKLKKAEVDLGRDEEALRVARAGFRAGTVTGAAVTGAEARAEASRKALEAARAELEKAYISFNKVVGLWPEDRPVLTDALSFTPLEIDSLDAEAARAVENSKDIWKLKQLVAIEQLDVDYPWGIGSGGVSYKYYDVEKPDVDIAELNVAAAESAIKEKVRTLYQDIRATEEQYNALLAAKQAAEEQLRVARALYDCGMTTLEKLKEAEAGCAEVENNIAGLVYKHAIQVANFNLLTGRPVVKGISDEELAAERKEQAKRDESENTEPEPTVVRFVMGEKSFRVNDRDVEMDVAPYAIDGRAFLPVRYAAQALGIPDENITWDGKTGMVTLVKGDRKITMKVGSRVMLVNTRVVEMDVAPQVKDGRVFLPVRYLGEALGAEFNWNYIRREVTVTI